MAKLYVIGNGFDIAHGLKTSYWHFREYLNKYAEEFLCELEKMYGLSSRSSKEASWNYLWKNFEHQLSQAEDEEVLDFSSSVVGELNLDTGPIGIEDTMNAYWDEQYGYIQKLNSYLHKWIRQVRLTKVVPRKRVLLNNRTDYFLTFNYTNVLEKKYNILSNYISHIHGGLMPYCTNVPMIGHGNKTKIATLRNKAKEAEAIFDEGTKSIYNALANYYERIHKNVNMRILINSDFFEKLEYVDEVVIIGHSLGAVDLPYLEVVQGIIAPTANWKVYYYKDEERQMLVNSIKSIGISSNKVKAFPTNSFWDISI